MKSVYQKALFDLTSLREYGVAKLVGVAVTPLLPQALRLAYSPCLFQNKRDNVTILLCIARGKSQKLVQFGVLNKKCR